MERPIQYAKTRDGVRIAYWTLGEGFPQLAMPSPPFSHAQLELQIPDWRREYERRAQNWKIIRYDCRGSGLSDRRVDCFSLDAYLLDLEAIVQHLKLERFALYGPLAGGMLAVAYAVRHPDRVSNLILWNAWIRGEDSRRAPSGDVLWDMLEKDWRLYTETLARVALGWDEQLATAYAAYMRQCVTPETGKAAMHAIREFDVTSLLSLVRVPTLVLHDRQIPSPGEQTVTELASQIPGASLHIVDAPVQGLSGIEETAAAIDRFLGETGPGPAPPDKLTRRELKIVCLIAAGDSSREIAERMGISRRTVERHIANIYAKTGTQNRAQASVYAIVHGLTHVNRNSTSA